MARHHHTFTHALRRRIYRPLPVAGSRECLFGWLVGILVGILAVTGIMLAFYYQPSADSAYASVKYVVRDVGGGWSGWLCRGIHAWAAQVLIAISLFQFVRVFLSGTYRGAGRSHWRIGLLFLALSFAFAITGDLLPWDDVALWSARDAIYWLDKLPLVGHRLAEIMRGGDEMGPTTLRNFYAFHVLFLPAIGVLLAWFWSWLPPLDSRRRRAEGTR